MDVVFYRKDIKMRLILTLLVFLGGILMLFFPNVFSQGRAFLIIALPSGVIGAFFLFIIRTGVDSTSLVEAYFFRGKVLKEIQRARYDEIIAVGASTELNGFIQVNYIATSSPGTPQKIRSMRIGTDVLGWENILLRIADHVPLDRFTPMALKTLKEARTSAGTTI